MTTKLYHSIHAPNGQEFTYEFARQEHNSLNGWVDDPAKIGINLWGAQFQEHVQIRNNEYLCGKIAGIELSHSENLRCPIWKTIASDDTTKIHKNCDSILYNSPRVGGRFFLFDKEIKRAIGKKDDYFKARLTSWIVNQRLHGTDHPVITTVVLGEIESSLGMNVYERADNLLKYCKTQTNKIGDSFSFTNQRNSCEAMAWSESIDPQEVQFLIDYMGYQGWLKRNILVEYTYKITVEGYAHLAELQKTSIESPRAFVAMWFDDSMNDVWENGIKAGIEAAGYRPVRIDRIEHNNKVDDEIIAEIRRSKFVVADFTQGSEGARGGVYYEAGFAHGLNLPVIFTCRKDTIDDTHFDTRQYNHILWTNPEQLKVDLSRRISATIGDGPDVPHGV